MREQAGMDWAEGGSRRQLLGVEEVEQSVLVWASAMVILSCWQVVEQELGSHGAQ